MTLSRLASVLAELQHRAGEADALERLQALPPGGAAEAAGIERRLRAARAAARNATPDHYKVLGVARDADSEEVRYSMLHWPCNPPISRDQVAPCSMLLQLMLSHA